MHKETIKFLFYYAILLAVIWVGIGMITMYVFENFVYKEVSLLCIAEEHRCFEIDNNGIKNLKINIKWIN